MIFLNSASSAAALVFYLPGVCTHIDTEGKQRKVRVRNILKSSEKNTIFNEHPVFDLRKRKCSPDPEHDKGDGEEEDECLEQRPRDQFTKEPT